MRRTLFRWNPNTQNKADTSSFTVEDVATQLISNVFVLFRLLSPCLKFSPHKSVQGWGSFGGNLGRGPPHCCASSFPAITTRPTPVHSQTYAWDLKISRRCFFLLVDLRPPLQSRGVVMNSRSSGLVYGELGTPSREVWERRNHQFWTHSSQNRLPLESS